MPTIAKTLLRYRRVLSVCTTIAATAAMLPQQLSAQERQAILEEIIVTAQKRAESMQRTPLSVTAISATTIEDMAISDISDIATITPNVQIQKTAGGSAASTIRIRGLANEDLILTADPKSAVYIDGVLVAKSLGSLVDVVDILRIEVLRGPQGTLFGRNSNGGAINVISKKPDNEWDFGVKVDAGRYSLLNTKTMLNIPLYRDDASGNSLAARVVYISREVDGWISNPLNGEDFGTEDRQGLNFALSWSTDNVVVDYAYDKSKWRDKGPAAVLELSGDPKSAALAGLLNNLIYPALTETGSIDEFIQLNRPSKVESDVSLHQELDVEGHNLTAAIDFADAGVLGDVTFTSITAYRETDNAALSDIDGTPLRIGYFRSPYRIQEQFTQEFQLSGLSWNERLDYVVGLYYFDEDGGELAFADTLVFPEVGFSDPLSSIVTDYEIDNQAWAIYGQATLADWVVDGLNLTLGVRYTEETRGLDITRSSSQVGILQDQTCDPEDSASFDPDSCGTFDLQGLEEDFSNTSLMANLSYQWNDELMTYFRVAQGFQSGGFNGRAATLSTVAMPYDEETVISYELGLKSQWFGNKMQLNGSIFYTENTDLQVAQFPPEATSASVGTIVVNAGEATIQGGELELVARPTANLDLYLNYAYLKPEYDEYILGEDLDGSPIDTADGREFKNAPAHTLGGGIKYHFNPFSFGQLSARLDVYWQDDIFLNGDPEIVADDPLIASDSKNDRAVNQQEAYMLVNARITLEQISLGNTGRFRLAVWGRNLTDEKYRYASIDLIDQLGFAISHYGDPRTYGITLAYDLR